MAATIPTTRTSCSDDRTDPWINGAGTKNSVSTRRPLSGVAAAFTELAQAI
jgi:hypothetical protein